MTMKKVSNKCKIDTIIYCTAEYECQDEEIYLDHFELESSRDISGQIKVMIFKGGDNFKRFIRIVRWGLGDTGEGSE